MTYAVRECKLKTLVVKCEHTGNTHVLVDLVNKAFGNSKLKIFTMRKRYFGVFLFLGEEKRSATRKNALRKMAVQMYVTKIPV